MSEEVKNDRRPADTAFKQQRLKAWQPILTPQWVILTFVIIGIVFIPIGIVALLSSNNVVEYSQRYDNLANCDLSSSTISRNCTITIDVKERMEKPVYFYYELHNFYQNHRRYVKSRSDEQLRNEANPDISNCEPLITNDAGKKFYPCGLIASSFFNDRFSMFSVSGTTRTQFSGNRFTNQGIAWESDLDRKFVDRPLQSDEVRPERLDFPGFRVDDPDFVVWMRTAGLPTFRKLYRIINDDIPAGTKLEVEIANNFAVHSFDGEKHVVISTTSWLGGRNNFLGIAYIVVGSLCIVLAIAFQIKQTVSPRKLGDASYLRWNRQAPGTTG